MARPTTARETIPGLGRVLGHLWPWMRAEKPLMAASAAALFAGVLMRLAEPWPLKLIMDRVIPSTAPAGTHTPGWVASLDAPTLLAGSAVAVVAISGMRALFDYHQRLGLAKIGNRVLRRVRNHVYMHVHALSLSFHTRSRTGDVISRVTRDVSLLRDVAATAALPLAANVLVIAGMGGVMLALQWRLALVAMLMLPMFALSTVRIGRGIREAARKQRRREGAMAASAVESISAIRDVQALSLGSAFAEDFSARNAKNQREEMRTARLSARLGRTVDLILAVSTASVLWYGTTLVMRGSLSPGDLLVFLTYLRRAYRPAKDFAKHTGRLAKAAAAGERVVALLEQEPEVRDLPGSVAAPPFCGAVRFEGVSFDYERDQSVLHDASFEIEPGQFVVLTGPSGAGKSTVIALLMRLYDPTDGRVCVDGRDVREYTLNSLRSQIGVVLQDTVLFTGTIRENIGCVAPEASAEDIESVARLANAHEFIVGLPDGYDTVVGERGATLSLGQRQRISIARAALRNCPILVLDEPTNGLDERNRHDVVGALACLSRGATTILVTHDLRLADRADLVLYLDGGGIVEAGHPAELLESGRQYAALHALQSRWKGSTSA